MLAVSLRILNTLCGIASWMDLIRMIGAMKKRGTYPIASHSTHKMCVTVSECGKQAQTIMRVSSHPLSDTQSTSIFNYACLIMSFEWHTKYVDIQLCTSHHILRVTHKVHRIQLCTLQHPLHVTLKVRQYSIMHVSSHFSSDTQSTSIFKYAHLTTSFKWHTKYVDIKFCTSHHVLRVAHKVRHHSIMHVSSRPSSDKKSTLIFN